MKKITFLVGLLVSVGTLSFNQTVRYEETEGEKNTTKINRTANVEITAGSGSTPPPTEPYPPTGPMLSVQTLGITSATTLYFDAIALASTTTTRDALYIKKDGKPVSNVLTDGKLAEVTADGDTYILGYSVTDLRGTGAGWNLTLQLGDFKETNVKEGESVHTLKGAKLSFPKVTPLTTPDAAITSFEAEAPVTYEREFAADSSGGAAVLMNAEKVHGRGLWEARYHSRELTLSDETTSEKQPIVLSVPGNNYAGTYQAILTWNLSEGPASSPAT